MAFPVIASQNTTVTTSTTPLTINMPSGIAAGDLLIAFGAHDTNVAMNGSGDWTEIQETANGTACQLNIYAKIAAGGDSTTPYSTSSTGCNPNARHDASAIWIDTRCATETGSGTAGRICEKNTINEQ